MITQTNNSSDSPDVFPSNVTPAYFTLNDTIGISSKKCDSEVEFS